MLGIDGPIVLHDGRMVFERRSRGCVHPLAATGVFRRSPRGMRGPRGRGTVPARVTWSRRSSPIFRVSRLLVGCGWPRCGILNLSNGLLAPLRGVTLKGLIPDIQSSEIRVQRQIPRDMIPSMTRARNWRWRSHGRCCIIKSSSETMARRRLVTIDLHWTWSTDRRRQGSLLRNHLIKTLNSRQSGRMLLRRTVCAVE